MGRAHHARFIAEPFAVRGALIGFEQSGVLAPLAPDHRDRVLLVLAEVLNNVAEHAYGDTAGPVAVRLCAHNGAVTARVIDSGRLPPALTDTPRFDPASLPEGGFGLGLIRALATDIDQRRRLGCNVLRFRVNNQVLEI